MSSFRILIIEEDEFLASTLVEELTRMGFEAEAVDTVVAGAEVFESGRIPDVVLLEQDMPDHPGDLACRELKAAEETRDLPVLLMSELPEEKLAHIARECGATGYLHKPFSPVRVIETLHALTAELKSPESIPPVPTHSLPPRRPGGVAEEGVPDAGDASWYQLSHQTRINPSENLSVLVVDDDPVALAILTDVLEDEGFEVHTAEAWPGFREKVLSQPYGVLVLDVNLPGMQGDKLALFVQNFIEPPKPRILLHSGIEEDELRRLTEAVGAVGYIRKGSASESVIEAVNQAAASFAREWQARHGA